MTVPGLNVATASQVVKQLRQQAEGLERLAKEQRGETPNLFFRGRASGLREAAHVFEGLYCEAGDRECACGGCTDPSGEGWPEGASPSLLCSDCHVAGCVQGGPCEREKTP